jgi:hypothetical protein
VLRRLAGLQLSASTCRRVTQAAGDRLGRHYAGGAVALPGRPAAKSPPGDAKFGCNRPRGMPSSW